MTKSSLVVSEIFGVTVQGEGPSIGRQCVFLRLGGCNLHCIWCDTAYTWRYSNKHPHRDNIVYDKRKELSTMTFEEVHDELRMLYYNNPNIIGTPLLVVSGGEPMLQAEALYQFLLWSETHALGWPHVEIETAGTLWHEGLCNLESVRFNVSPKLHNSANSLAERFRPVVLNRLALSGRAIFKFVVSTGNDFDEIDRILKETEIMRHQVYIMPEGNTRARFIETQLQVAEEAIQRGFNLTTRLHILLWDKKRGV